MTASQQAKTEVSNDLTVQTDTAASMKQQTAAQWLDSYAEDVLTDVVIFDTSLPADSLTGLPPVRAIAKQRKASNASRKAKVAEQQEQHTEGSALTTDKGRAHWEQQEQHQEKQKPAAAIMQMWFVGLLSVVSLMLLAFVVAFIRFKNKVKQ